MVARRGEPEQDAFGREERARALALGSLVIAGVGLADWLLGRDAAPRALVWAGWLGLYLAAAALTRRGPAWAPRAIGQGASLVAVAAVLALAALGGGSRSPLFLILPLVPLVSALVGPGDVLVPAAQGLVAVSGGAVLLRLEARPWNEVAVWAGTAAAATAFALGSARRTRRRQEAHVLALEERALAQERLAEAERRRGEAERWVAAGHLADQVAHDVNSPLASLRSNLRYAREELDGADPEVLQALTDGEAAIEEIRAAVSSLRVRTLPPGRRDAG